MRSKIRGFFKIYMQAQCRFILINVWSALAKRFIKKNPQFEVYLEERVTGLQQQIELEQRVRGAKQEPSHCLHRLKAKLLARVSMRPSERVYLLSGKGGSWMQALVIGLRPEDRLVNLGLHLKYRSGLFIDK